MLRSCRRKNFGMALAFYFPPEGSPGWTCQVGEGRAASVPREEATAMIQHSNYHQLVSRGRKAGLTTRELNSALSVHPVTGHEPTPRQADCNGFFLELDASGHRTYRPVTPSPRT